MKKHSGFSLVEMLVVVTIVAILAAAMVTTYQLYSTRSKVSKSINILQNLAQQVMVSYNSKGSMPVSLQGISGGGYGAYVIPDTTTYLHYDNGATWANKGGLIQLNLDENIGKGILGFTPTTTGADGDYNAIAMAFYDNNGTLTVYCGQWDSTSSLYIPLDYLPAGCNSTDFNTIVTGN